MSDRISQAADAICGVIETRALSIGDFIEALDLALHRQYEATLEHLVRTEQLRLLKEIRAAVVTDPPAARWPGGDGDGDS